MTKRGRPSRGGVAAQVTLRLNASELDKLSRHCERNGTSEGWELTHAQAVAALRAWIGSL